MNDKEKVNTIAQLAYEEGVKRGRKEVVEWCNENFEPTVPMTLDYRKWHKQLKKWELTEPLL